MISLNNQSAHCFVFTFKEGLLSPIAHDLKLSVTRFTIQIDPEAHTADAHFEADSLRVVSARRQGRDAPELLSAKDRGKIERNIRDDVLHVDRYPDIRWRGSYQAVGDDRIEAQGELTLHGVARSLPIVLTAKHDEWQASVRIHQPDFAIRPYQAALGTLRVGPDVTIELHLPRV